MTDGTEAGVATGDEIATLVEDAFWLAADVEPVFDVELDAVLGVGLELDVELGSDVEDIASAGAETEADFQADAEFVWDPVGVIGLSTWLTERPSQVWSSRKSCPTFSLPTVNVTVWMTVPFWLAVTWYCPGERAIW